MFELLLLVLMAGLCMSVKNSSNVANPFLIYFVTWGTVFLLIYFDRGSYRELSEIFLFLIFTVKLCSILLLVTLSRYSDPVIIKPPKCCSSEKRVKTLTLDIALLLGIACSPMVYLKGSFINGGTDVFSVSGYISLRGSLTDGSSSYGFLSYIMVMTWVATSMRFYLYLKTRENAPLVALSMLVGLFYVYLSTGRTFLVFFLSMLFVPGIVTDKFHSKVIVIFSFLFVGCFILITAMTAKGISLEAGIFDNIFTTLQSIRVYLLGPVLAFNTLFDTSVAHDLGLNSFRFFFALLNSLGVSDLQPVKLIKDYVFVPFPVNVYTVYEVYFRDFFVLGVFLPSLFLISHNWLYTRARIFRGKWLFIYAASVPPLVMQFFSDFYFSLFSLHLQTIFWVFFFSFPSREKI